jgi:hypothetical protein
MMQNNFIKEQIKKLNLKSVIRLKSISKQNQIVQINLVKVTIFGTTTDASRCSFEKKNGA